MNSGTSLVVEDGMKFVVTFQGETAIASFLQALKGFVAEIPALWTLQEITADGDDVANLRRSDVVSSID